LRQTSKIKGISGFLSNSFKDYKDQGGFIVLQRLQQRTSIQHWIANSAIYLLLGLAAFAGYAMPLRLLFGLEFTLGGIFLFIALRKFGIGWTMLMGVTVHSLAALLVDASFSIWIHTLELLAVAWYMRAFRSRSLVAGDLAFWLMIGLPVLVTVYSLYFQTIDKNLYFVLLVLLTNSLFNALLAELAITYSPKTGSVQLGTMLFHLTVMGIIAALFWSLLSSSRATESSIFTYLSQEAQITTDSAKRLYDSLSQESLRGFKLGSMFEVNRMRSLLDVIAIDSGAEAYRVVDWDGQTIVSSGDSHEDPSHWMRSMEWKSGSTALYMNLPPKSWTQFANSRWMESSIIYIRELDPFVIYLSYPSSKYQDELYNSYESQVQGILMLAVMLILFALALYRAFIQTVKRLIHMTKDMPARMYRGETIVWPETRITEVHLLSRNFQQITGRLDEMLKEAQQLANHDMLTGLSNRRSFVEYLERKTEEAAAGRGSLAVMFIDLDRFKQINDSLGHDVGDKLLIKVAGRLKKVVGSDGFVARLGGDEFVIVLTMTLEEKTVQVADQVLRVLEKPFFVDTHELFISASIGISVFPQHGETVTEVIKFADTAMYQAKESGGNTFRFFDDPHLKHVSERMTIEFELRKAIERDELTLHYQPVIDSISRQVVWVEALLRWTHAQLGQVSPAVFIPVAESSGFIKPLGDWVIRQACRQAKQWQEQGWSIGVGVNCSSIQFDYNLADFVIETLTETGLDPRFLKLEITEGVFLQRKEVVLKDLGRLKDAGVQVWIDDFGTGYSSLSLLVDLPIEGFKIDRSFIRNMSNNSAGASIASTIIQLARGRGCQVIAEGVENRHEAVHLNDLGCYNHQGYLYSKPAPHDELLDLLIQEGYVQGVKA
jgi:diguanylate cyclase